MTPPDLLHMLLNFVHRTKPLDMLLDDIRAPISRVARDHVPSVRFDLGCGGGVASTGAQLQLVQVCILRSFRLASFRHSHLGSLLHLCETLPACLTSPKHPPTVTARGQRPKHRSRPRSRRASTHSTWDFLARVHTRRPRERRTYHSTHSSQVDPRLLFGVLRARVDQPLPSNARQPDPFRSLTACSARPVPESSEKAEWRAGST